MASEAGPRVGKAALVAAAAVLLGLWVSGPALYATFATPPDLRFTGSLEGSDGHAYLAWVRQAAEGRWLLRDRYTTEPTTARVFHPVFVAAGLAVRATGGSLLTVWAMARVLAAAAAVVALYLFARHMCGAGRAASGLVLVCSGAGLGWLRGPLGPSFGAIDGWIPEATFYQSLRWPVVWAVALALVMAAFACMADAVAGARWPLALAGGAVGALVVFVHPYQSPTLLAVPAAFVLVESAFASPSRLRPRLACWAAMAAMMAPALLWQLHLLRSDAVLGAHARTPMRTPSLVWCLAGFGPVLLALAAAGVSTAWRSGPRGRFLLAWAAAGGALLYAPVPFSRRLVTGLMIPVGLLAAFGLERLLARQRALTRVLALVLVAALLAPTNILATLDDWSRVQRRMPPPFISGHLGRALEWLSAAPAGVVLSSARVGSLVPPFAGQTAYVGHWAQTLEHGRKAAEVARLLQGALSPAERQDLLSRSGARYVLRAPGELDPAPSHFRPEEIGRVGFRSGHVEVVEIGVR